MKQHYEVIVIGGGPAGYTAALYAARAGLSTLVIEKLYAGGQMAQTAQIDNYPGFDRGVDGYTLSTSMQAGAERFGAETLSAEVLSVSLTGKEKTVTTADGAYTADAVIIATGADHRPLGLEHEAELVGKGVSYCAACDGMLYRRKTVAVVGGGDSAAAAALTLSRLSKKVYLIHRRDSLRASRSYQDPLRNADNIEFVWNAAVSSLLYGETLTGVRLKNTRTGEERTLSLDGLFVCIGRVPASELFRGQLELDPAGYLAADESTRTAIPGVYAAGDVRSKAVRQIVTAAADGAVAAHCAEEYLLGGA